MAGAAGRLIAAAMIASGGVAAGIGAVDAAHPAASDGPDALADSVVGQLAGRYSNHSRNALVDGTEFWSDDVAEIVPVDARHAHVRFDLHFYNDHGCTLAGVAEARGDALVYRGPPDDNFLDQPPCRLTIRRSGDQLAWSDDDGTCKGHCGVRGSFRRDGLPWRSRHPIRYLTRLRSSVEYRAAIVEWRQAR